MLSFEKVEGEYFEDGLEDVEMILFEKVEEGLKHWEHDEMQFAKVEGDYFEDGLEGVADNDFEFLDDFVEEDVDEQKE